MTLPDFPPLLTYRGLAYCPAADRAPTRDSGCYGVYRGCAFSLRVPDLRGWTTRWLGVCELTYRGVAYRLGPPPARATAPPPTVGDRARAALRPTSAAIAPSHPARPAADVPRARPGDLARRLRAIAPDGDSNGNSCALSEPAGDRAGAVVWPAAAPTGDAIGDAKTAVRERLARIRRALQQGSQASGDRPNFPVVPARPASPPRSPEVADRRFGHHLVASPL